MPSSSIEDSRPALLFIPDISGFTQFVATTEISHSRHIIEELLEKLLDANDSGLQVSEIEGDAILFYRFGPGPGAEEYFEQVRKMFVAFHGHLRRYETQRICQCGACRSAHSLTLKIVAHYGSVAETRIKEHVKLFGPDVITVHRLLKNDIAHHEYALFTDTLRNEWQPMMLPEWVRLEEGSQQYDVGAIRYGYTPLRPLLRDIPEPRVEDYSIADATVPVFSFEYEIVAPVEFVFETVIDMQKRLKWMEGAKRVDMLSDQVTRLGTRHRCVIDEKSPVMVTSRGPSSDGAIVLAETDEKRTMCSVFTFRQLDGGRTLFRIDGFLKNSLILRVLFSLLLRKKVTRLFATSGSNLKRYCEQAYRTGQS